jgi:acetylglutamate kinase
MNANDDPGPSLLEAGPHIARFRDQFVVVKLGGELFEQAGVLERIVPQLVLLRQTGLRPVVVHGGGTQIDRHCADRGVAVDKRGGRRVTTPEALQVVLDVVAGELNGQLVRLLRDAGVDARGYHDDPALRRCLRCDRRPPREVSGEAEPIDFGEVGDVREVETEPLRALEAGVPVLPSIGRGEHGPLNVNADSVAAHIAIALGAQKLVLVSSVPGVLASLDDEGPIAQLSRDDVDALLDEGSGVVGGMRAKLEEARRAIDGGVRQVHVISGLEPKTLLREIFTDEGCGTLIS